MTTIVSPIFLYSEPIPNISNFCYFFLFSFSPPAFSYVEPETKRYWKVCAEILVQEKRMPWMNNLIKFKSTYLFF